MAVNDATVRDYWTDKSDNCSIFVSKTACSGEGTPNHTTIKFLNKLRKELNNQIDSLDPSIQRSHGFWISEQSSGDPVWVPPTRAAFDHSRLFVIILQDEYFQQHSCIDELLWFCEALCSAQQGSFAHLPKLLSISIRNHDKNASRTLLQQRLDERKGEISPQMWDSLKTLLSEGFPFPAASHPERLTHNERTYRHYDDVRNEGNLEDLFVRTIAGRIIKVVGESTLSFSSFSHSTSATIVPAIDTGGRVSERIPSRNTSTATRVIRLGVVPLMSNALNLRNRLSTELNRITDLGFATGYRFEVADVKDYRQVVDKLVLVDQTNAERIDAAFLGPAAFNLAKQKLCPGYELQPVAARHAPEGTDYPRHQAGRVYRWLLVARKSDFRGYTPASTYSMFQDCRQLRDVLAPLSGRFQIGFSDQDSTSGFAKPGMFLNQGLSIGLHDWERVVFCRSHDLTYYWLSGSDARSAMESDGYKPAVFPPQLVAGFGPETFATPRIAAIDSDVFAQLKQDYPNSETDALCVLWESHCVEHQYPWAIVRPIEQEHAQYAHARNVRTALLDVLPQIKDRIVLKAFAAKGFWCWEENASPKQDIFHFEQRANAGKDCGTVGKCGCSVCG